MAQRKSPGEFETIAKAFAPLATHSGALGLRDDAAILPQKSGLDLIVTKDAIVEGVHFLPNDPADLIARKLLRVNISDLAAKGAVPFGYLIASAFPKTAPSGFAKSFAKGLAKDQKKFGLSLFGGDTVVTPGPSMFSCTMFGFAPRGRMIRRNGARPGDDVWVTGTIGDSGAGLAILTRAASHRGADADWLKGRYQLPSPPVSFGRDLIGIANAAMDVSDGLAQDAGHLAKESDVRIELRAFETPLSPQYVRTHGDMLAARLAAIAAGDDYQIIFTAHPRRRAAIETLSRKHIVRVTRIGLVKEGRGVVVMNQDGKRIRLQTSGYTHF